MPENELLTDDPADKAADTADDKGATPDLAAEVEKWKALSRKNEADKKANAEKAKKADELQKRLDEIENAGKSELEKAIARAEAAEKRAQELDVTAKSAQLAALKAEVGAEKGLPAALINRLTGEDRESIAADADAILAALPKSAQAVDIGQGKSGSQTTNPALAAFVAGVKSTRKE